MKTISKIILFLISIQLFSCNQCPPTGAEPFDPIFSFSLVDKDGIDLFFGIDCIYNPDSLKITIDHNCSSQYWYLEVDNKLEKCFNLYFPQGTNSIFYIEFVPNEIDTLKIESHFVKWYEEPEGCKHFPVYKNDLFFNNDLICSNCSGEIYKIIIE